jgi:2-keto-4-pentenoate hydratase
MRVAALREARGERVAGYKLGCAGAAIQRQLGISDPVFGHIFEGELHRSGISLDAACYDGLAIEGEFALRLKEDYREGAPAAAAAFAVIELHQFVFRSPAGFTAEELVANNALQAGVVLPMEEVPCGDISAWSEQKITVTRNGAVLGTGCCSVLTGGPPASVTWLAGRLASYGKSLRAGQIVLTGSPLPLFRVGPGDRVEVSCGRLPPVAIQLLTRGIERQI